MLDEGLPRPARVDGHAQREIESAGDLAQRGGGSGGVDRHADAGAVAADQIGGIRQVGSCLRVKGHRVGARPDELRDLAHGTLDHEVDVDHRARLADLLGEPGDDQRTDRDRRDEVTIHHIDVDHARARL